MNRVLITGIEGFTGRYLAAELEAHGWEVWGLGLRDANGEARQLRCDLGDLDGLKRAVAEVQPDAAIHLAAIAFPGHGDSTEFYHTNLIGSRNLLVALAGLRRKPTSVLLASSATVYGNSLEGLLDERSPTNPTSEYAVSKLAMEYMARLWLSVLPIVIVRPFNYTGVGQPEHFLLPKIVAHFRRRAEVIELGNTDVSRDFCDVRAVARAYRGLLETQPTGEVINVSSGRVHSLRDIIAMATMMTGHDLRVEVNPRFVRPAEVKSLGGNPAKLQALVGGWDTPPLEHTLRWMLACSE